MRKNNNLTVSSSENLKNPEVFEYLSEFSEFFLGPFQIFFKGRVLFSEKTLTKDTSLNVVFNLN